MLYRLVLTRLMLNLYEKNRGIASRVEYDISLYKRPLNTLCPTVDTQMFPNFLFITCVLVLHTVLCDVVKYI